MSDFWNEVLGPGGDSGACNTLQRLRGIALYPPMSKTHNGENAPLSPPSPQADEANPPGDDYAAAERQAIAWESEQPPVDDPAGTAGVRGFEGLPDLTPAQHGVIQRRLMGMDTTPPPAARPGAPTAPQSAPATVTCSACAEFTPGREPEGLGRCSRTADGLPPIASRGYGVCFPHAPRTCPDFKEILK